MNNLNLRFLDANSNSFIGKKLTLTPTLIPEITASWLTTGDSYTFVTDITGSVTGSVVPNIYTAFFSPPETLKTNFYLGVTETGSYIVSASNQSGSSQDVFFDLFNLVKDVKSVKKLTLTPTWNYPYYLSGSVIVLAPTSSVPANGYVDFSALVPGLYQVDAIGKVTSTFYISVPSAPSQSWNAKDLLVVKPSKGIAVKLTNLDNSYVLTVSSSDARYIMKGEDVPIAGTASWAVNSETASYLNGTASWATNVINGGATIFTASTYPITSSWAENATSAAFSTNASSAVLATNATWATNSINANNATWATNSLDSNNATWATNSLNANTASWAIDVVNKSSNLITASTIPITSSWAVNALNGGTTITSGSSFNITSSWATVANKSYITSSNGEFGFLFLTATKNKVGEQQLYANDTLLYSPSTDNLIVSSASFGSITAATAKLTASWANNANSASHAIFADSASVINVYDDFLGLNYRFDGYRLWDLANFPLPLFSVNGGAGPNIVTNAPIDINPWPNSTFNLLTLRDSPTNPFTYKILNVLTGDPATSSLWIDRTGLLHGTASVALVAYNANTASLATRALNADSSSWATNATSASRYVLKAGDTVSGLIDFQTAGEARFENSSNGISFAGATPTDFIFKIANNNLLSLISNGGGTIYFSGSRIISASIDNALNANTASVALNALTASVAVATQTADFALLAGAAITSTSASVAVSSSWAPDSLPFVGLTSVPSFTTGSASPSGSTIFIGTSSVNLCTTADGTGIVNNYNVQSASFAMTASFLDVQYVVATYNNGSPVYTIVTDKSTIDNIQTTWIYSVLVGANGSISYMAWDSPGSLLANKDNNRVVALRGVERESGLDISISGSSGLGFYISSGKVWQGIQTLGLESITSSVNRIVQVAHSASVFSASLITAFNNTQYDNGVNLAPLSNNYYNVNWVYRACGNLKTTVVQVGSQYQKFADAVASQPMPPPSELTAVSVLVGRAICQQGNANVVQLDSAFIKSFVPAGITNHNSLSGLQGGASIGSGEYYHLSGTEYTGSGGSGAFLRQTGSNFFGTSSIAVNSINALSASAVNVITSAFATGALDILLAPGAQFTQPLIDGNLTYDISAKRLLSTASWAVNSTNATSAAFATNASILSGSAYIPLSGSIQFNTSSIYIQPFQEGKMFWDQMDRCVDIQMGNAVTLQVGEELVIRVRAGENIFDGGVVYATGQIYHSDTSSVDRMIVKLAQADGTGTKATILGVATETINSGSSGFINVVGDIHNFPATGLSVGTAYLSTTNSGSVTSTRPLPPYEQVIVGNILVTGSNGTIAVNIANPPNISELLSAGMTSLPVISFSGSGTGGAVLVTSGASVNLYNTPTANDQIKNYFLPAFTGSIPVTGSTYYLVANWNGGSPVYNVLSSNDTIDQIQIVNVATLTRPTYNPNSIEYITHDFFGLALANKLNKRAIRTERFAHETGLILGESGSRAVTITAGTMWFGGEQITASAFNSTVQTLRLYQTSTGSSTGWSSSVVTAYNNTQYDPGNGTGLVALGTNNYAVNFVFRSLANNDTDSYIVLGNGSYTLTQAQASQPPANLPSTLSPSTGLAVLVGRIIVQKNALTSTQIDSAWATNFAASQVTDHNALSNLQGGTSGEYYHLTSAEYTLLHAGTSSFALTSSVALSSLNAGTTLFTASTYPITSSWAVNTVNGGSGTTLFTGSKYPITASWANTASIAITALNAGTTLFTASTYPITSSWATNVVNGGSGTTLFTASTYDITASWSDNTRVSNTIVMTETEENKTFPVAFVSAAAGTLYIDSDGIVVNPSDNSITAGTFNGDVSGSVFGTASWAINTVNGGGSGTTLFTGSTYPITSSWATNVVNKSSNLITASTIPITSSWAVNSTTASVITAFDSFLGEQYVFDGYRFYDLAQFSLPLLAVYGGAGPSITTNAPININPWPNSTFDLLTLTDNGTNPFTYKLLNVTSASVSLASINRQGKYVGTSSWADNASNAISAAFAPTTATTLFTGSTYQITSSWAVNSKNAQTSSLESVVTSAFSTGAANLIFTDGTGNKQLYVDNALTVDMATKQILATSSWAVNVVNPGSSGTTLFTGSTYPITSSWASSYTLTASDIFLSQVFS